jgi:hypothetical protein
MSLEDTLGHNAGKLQILLHHMAWIKTLSTYNHMSQNAIAGVPKTPHMIDSSTLMQILSTPCLPSTPVAVPVPAITA